MARIVTVYTDERQAGRLIDMSYIRWHRISEALAARGHRVDMATGEFKRRLRRPVVEVGPNLRRVPLGRVKWSDYDVVKTLFHRGFTLLERREGDSHPFVISKLGSVVGPEDLPGIYFYGARRAEMYEVQRRISRRSRYVTLLTEPARRLWRESFGGDERILLVPGAADETIPDPGADPFPDGGGRPRALFMGNFYSPDPRTSQPEASRTLVGRLNRIGAELGQRGGRLHVLGPGDHEALDPAHVTCLGVVETEATWNYMHHADVGVLVSAGAFMHNNESTKIYHYARAGLPFVAERGFPNDDVAAESGLCIHVEPDRPEAFARAVVEAASRDWNRAAGVEYILRHHTWCRRAGIYDRLLRKHFGEPSGAGDAPPVTRA